MKQRMILRGKLDLSIIISLTVLVLIFSLTGCSSGGGDGANNAGDVPQDAMLYQQAYGVYQAGDYSAALAEFQSLIAQFPNSIYVDNSHYYTARCYHQLQDFSTARNLYDAFVAAFPASNYVDNAQYFKAQAFHDEGDYDSARAGYSVLIAADVSAWADDAKYQFAKTYYDAALAEPDAGMAIDLFGLAIGYFNEMIDSNNPLYQTSNRLDSAYYFKGRSLQRQGDLIAPDANLGNFADKYTEARIVFRQFLDLMPTSTWADNALYQLGSTFYDEASIANINGDYATMRDKLSSAIGEYTALLNDPLYQTLNSADNAQYYLGRSYQMILTMPANERGVDFANVTYDTARAALNTLIQNFPQSAWIDNAYYEIANTYYAEAELASENPVKELAFNNALAKYFTLVSTYPGSIRFDNSVFKIAWIYHLGDNCALEQEWFEYHATLNMVSAGHATVRDEHIADLTLEVRVVHACPLPPTLTLNTYNAQQMLP